MVHLASILANTKERVDPNTWTAICNGLSIGSADLDCKQSAVKKSNVDTNGVPTTKHKMRKEKLVHNGYALVDDSFDVKLLREGIEALYKNKIPATFILLFDEAWQLASQSKHVLETSSHEKNVFNYDLLAWYIPPGSPGFSPHRDRQPDDAPSTFHSDDQQAKFITNWIALSDATPENSCLYVIPKPYDPGYTVGDIDSVDENDCNEGSAADPLHRALSSKEAFQHIRCLPRKAGQSILFTHRIIHWGSQGDPPGTPAETSVSPRIAISFVASDPDFEAPLLVNHEKYFSTESRSGIVRQQFPPLYIRLLLVCAQLLIYYQRFDLEKSVIKACYEYCKQHQDELEESYRRKVFVEFVKAMKEQNGADPQTTIDNTANKDSTANDCDSENDDNDDEDDDDDEDAMLEEMLNAEAGGYGEFEDDYDDLGEGDDFGDEEDGEDEEEDEVDLFGQKRKSEDVAEASSQKKTKTFIT